MSKYQVRYKQDGEWYTAMFGTSGAALMFSSVSDNETDYHGEVE